MRIVHDHPTVENTDLLALHARISPQTLQTEDKYLLAYAGNTWQCEMPLCVYHPPSATIRAPFELQGEPFVVPFDASLAGAEKVLVPETNTITLSFPAIVYFLVENIVIRLPTTQNGNQREEIILSLPYSDIIQHSITCNLTRLQLVVQEQSQSHSYFLVLYPLQRYPPQPLIQGLFNVWSRQTPLESLHFVNDIIGQGRDLAQQLSLYYESQQDDGLVMIDDDQELGGICSTGQADDEDFSFDFVNGLDSGVDVTLVGGSEVSGLKRSRFHDSQSSLVSSAGSNGDLKNGGRERVKRMYVARIKR